MVGIQPSSIAQKFCLLDLATEIFHQFFFVAQVGDQIFQSLPKKIQVATKNV